MKLLILMFLFISISFCHGARNTTGLDITDEEKQDIKALADCEKACFTDDARHVMQCRKKCDNKKCTPNVIEFLSRNLNLRSEKNAKLLEKMKESQLCEGIKEGVRSAEEHLWSCHVSCQEGMHKNSTKSLASCIDFCAEDRIRVFQMSDIAFGKAMSYQKNLQKFYSLDHASLTHKKSAGVVLSILFNAIADQLVPTLASHSLEKAKEYAKVYKAQREGKDIKDIDDSTESQKEKESKEAES